MKVTSVHSIIILLCFLLQTGCAITFKKQYQNVSGATSTEKLLKKKKYKVEEKEVFDPYSRLSLKNKNLIESFYNKESNASVLKNAILRTPLTDKQEKSLVASSYVAKDINVIPLPLGLSNRLTDIPSSMLVVQAGRNIILMNASSRQIIDIIKIKK